MTITSDLLLKQLTWRYAVKKFDPTRKIDPDTWQALMEALVLSPSSYGLQPWRFVVITNPAIKAQLPVISWKQNQPQDCSHMVVLAAAEKLDAAYIDDQIQQIAAARGVAPESLAGYRKMLISAVNALESTFEWSSRQVYLALGQLMNAAAMLGIDSCPMEGIDPAAYDNLLGMSDSGYRSVVGCALGYRDPSDPYASLKKVRFPVGQVVHEI